jgi:hypothetical protein
MSQKKASDNELRVNDVLLASYQDTNVEYLLPHPEEKEW